MTRIDPPDQINPDLLHVETQLREFSTLAEDPRSMAFAGAAAGLVDNVGGLREVAVERGTVFASGARRGRQTESVERGGFWISSLVDFDPANDDRDVATRSSYPPTKRSSSSSAELRASSALSIMALILSSAS